MRLNEDRKLEINVRLLNELLSVAQQNGTSIIFFVDKDFAELPQEIQKVLKENAEGILYINGQKALADRFQRLGIDRNKLLNGSNHFNSHGNQIYAEVVAGILASQPWGSDNQRRFRFDHSVKGFVAVN